MRYAVASLLLVALIGTAAGQQAPAKKYRFGDPDTLEAVARDLLKSGAPDAKEWIKLAAQVRTADTECRKRFSVGSGQFDTCVDELTKYLIRLDSRAAAPSPPISLPCRPVIINGDPVVICD